MLCRIIDEWTFVSCSVVRAFQMCEILGTASVMVKKKPSSVSENLGNAMMDCWLSDLNIRR